MSTPETPEEQAHRMVSDTAVRAFKTPGASSVANAGAMVALGAIASGEIVLARQLFEQARQLTPKPQREQALLTWGLWVAEADNGPAAVALAEMGLDWHTAEAPYSNYKLQLGLELMRPMRGVALRALVESGHFDPLSSCRSRQFTAAYGSLKWLAWAALDAEHPMPRAIVNSDRNADWDADPTDAPQRDPAPQPLDPFRFLLNHPLVRQDAGSLDDALWSVLQYPDHKTHTAHTVKLLLEAGANAFKTNATGNRTRFIQASDYSSDGPLAHQWKPCLTNPLLELGESWFSDSERKVVAERAVQWTSYATLKNETQRALHEALEAHPPREASVQHLKRSLEELDQGHWPENTREKDWDLARDLICLGARHFADSHAKGVPIWNAAAPLIEWSQVAPGRDGLNIVAFLMCQKEFGYGRSKNSDLWKGSAMLQTLLEAGASLQAQWPEQDPRELALALAINGHPGSFEAVRAHTLCLGEVVTVSPDTLARAANCLAQQAIRFLKTQRMVSQTFSEIAPERLALFDQVGQMAHTAALGVQWGQFVAEWQNTLKTIGSNARTPREQPALAAQIERLHLLADAFRSPPTAAPDGNIPTGRSRSVMRL